MLRKRLGPEAIEKDWSWRKGLVDYFKITTSLIIPESVEVIGGCAFEDCWWLKKVVIPGSVKIIEDNAFWGCEEATIMIMNKSSEKDFKYLGRRAFRYCKEVSYVKEEAWD